MTLVDVFLQAALIVVVGGAVLMVVIPWVHYVWTAYWRWCLKTQERMRSRE